MRDCLPTKLPQMPYRSVFEYLLTKVEQTVLCATHVSAFDPKRTLPSALHISELSHAHRLSSSVNGVNCMLWRGAVGSISIRYTFPAAEGLVLGRLNATMFDSLM